MRMQDSFVYDAHTALAGSVVDCYVPVAEPEASIAHRRTTAAPVQHQRQSQAAAKRNWPRQCTTKHLEQLSDKESSSKAVNQQMCTFEWPAARAALAGTAADALVPTASPRSNVASIHTTPSPVRNAQRWQNKRSTNL